MSRARDIANFDPALLIADEVSLDKVNGGTLGTGTIGGSSVINTSGAITTTGTATFSGDLVPSTSLSHRNLIINGAMNVAQRATSKTSVLNGYSTADRWKTFQSTVGVFTQSIESDAPAGRGFTKSLKMNCTTAEASIGSADRLWVDQLLEGQNIQSFQYGTSSAKDMTFSFWVKSNVIGTYIIMLYAASGRSVSQSYTINASETWEQKTVTFSGDTTGTFTVNNTGELDIRWFMAAGSNYTSGTLSTTWSSTVNANTAVGQTNLASAVSNYWQITGVQLELGSNATPFEHRSYGDELARCHRYYFKINGSQYDQIALCQRHNTTNMIFPYQLPVPLRTNSPTVTSANLALFYGGVGSWTTTYTTVGLYSLIDDSNLHSMVFQMTGTSSAIDSGIVACQNNGYLAVDGEI